MIAIHCQRIYTIGTVTTAGSCCPLRNHNLRFQYHFRHSSDIFFGLLHLTGCGRLPLACTDPAPTQTHPCGMPSDTCNCQMSAVSKPSGSWHPRRSRRSFCKTCLQTQFDIVFNSLTDVSRRSRRCSGHGVSTVEFCRTFLVLTFLVLTFLVLTGAGEQSAVAAAAGAIDAAAVPVGRGPLRGLRSRADPLPAPVRRAAAAAAGHGSRLGGARQRACWPRGSRKRQRQRQRLGPPRLRRGLCARGSGEKPGKTMKHGRKRAPAAS